LSVGVRRVSWRGAGGRFIQTGVVLLNFASAFAGLKVAAFRQHF
jgi:hypothetical protein